ncbi:MAG: hypothetical protein AAGD43_26240 [Pseudomonadota bacterium]
MQNFPADAIEEWDTAIEEYFATQEIQEDQDIHRDRPFDYYAFKGHAQGTYTLEFHGKRVERKLRVDWQYTPDREHYE